MPWLRHSRPWPAGSRATTDIVVGCDAVAGPSAAIQPLGGEVQHRREHAVQVGLLHLLTRQSLGRLEQGVGGDGVGLPAAE